MLNVGRMGTSWVAGARRSIIVRALLITAPHVHAIQTRARGSRIKASDPVQEMTAHNVICLPDPVDPRGPKGK